MEASLPSADRIVIFAGLDYRKFLMDYLRQRTPVVEVPMEKLKFGMQLKYLRAELQHD